VLWVGDPDMLPVPGWSLVAAVVAVRVDHQLDPARRVVEDRVVLAGRRSADDGERLPGRGDRPPGGSAPGSVGDRCGLVPGAVEVRAGERTSYLPWVG
jgi:hypothetical protein